MKTGIFFSISRVWKDGEKQRCKAEVELYCLDDPPPTRAPEAINCQQSLLGVEAHEFLPY